MKEVAKSEFRAFYFEHGREKDGWGRAYWDKFFEPEPKNPMRYLVEEPASPTHCRLMIVTDYAAKEYRAFFLTEEAEEGFFGR